MVDEADIDMVGSASSNSKAGGLKRALPPSDSGGPLAPRPPPNKRKPGPIPKDVIVRRPSYSPVNTPPSSPIPWMDESKNQVVPTANTNNISNSSSASGSPSPSPPPQIVPDKLVNGLNEIPAMPVFEPIPIEPVVVHYEPLPPLTLPTTIRVTTNNLEAPKCEIKNENIDHVDVNNVDDFGDTQNSVEEEYCRGEPQVDTNHVEERRENKIEKEKSLPKKELDEIRKHNLSVRESVYKEVRRRGKSKIVF